ncbi:MAG: hypothetical protein H7A38_05590 [Chlamydiales bacterium]|nr:hypothetical protein [Chlamydiales bacterium]
MEKKQLHFLQKLRFIKSLTFNEFAYGNLFSVKVKNHGYTFSEKFDSRCDPNRTYSWIRTIFTAA